jgi:membrane-associated phospholipid phosphatase
MHGVARWVSRLFHPFVLPVPTLVAALALQGVGWREIFGWTALSVAVAIVPPTLLLVIQRRHDGDWYVTVREQRHSVYLVGAACLVALLVLLWLGDAPPLMRVCLLAAIVANAIGMSLNGVTKVSVHSGAAAGCAMLLAWLVPAALLLLAATVGLVGWARVRLGHHTPVQVLLGAGITATCVGLALTWWEPR